MKKIYFTFLLILCFNLIQAQQIDYRKSYYPAVNKAELAISDNKYNIALNFYLEAFQNVPNPFSKDLFNAAVCAALEQNVMMTISFCEKLLLSGTEITFIQSQKVFRRIEEDERWKHFIANYANYRRRYLLNVNMPLRKELELLTAYDQHFRIQPNGYVIYKDTINAIDISNIDRVKFIIEKYGFPGEDLIGVKDPLSAPPFHSILYHHCQKAADGFGKGMADFPGDLSDAVKYGKLDPHRFASYVDIQGQPVYGNTAFYRIGREGELRYLNMSDNVLKKINKRRASIGLEPLGEYRKKILFSIKDDRFIFNFNDSIIVLEGLDSRDIDNLIENSSLVKTE
ncbi:MAG: hypothetical protein CMO01_08930 [Thalassobius sp.]|nr:hypothetical protein [Thalassovita sp.]